MLRKAPGLSAWIFLGLVLGVVAGIIAHHQIWGDIEYGALSDKTRAFLKTFATEKVKWYQLLSDIFINLVKVIVAPLVFSLLLTGLVKSGNFSAMGRIGIKTLVYFTFATLIALSMGLIIVNLFEPGKSLQVSSALEKIAAPQEFNGVQFILHIFPKNIFEALLKPDILQIIVFTILFAAGCSAIGEKAKPIIEFFDAVAHVMLKITGYIMYLAPLAVFGAVAK
ncbi:MAG TPA: cation:dicarboxylase symporter family transporter, partial [Bacteroidia bacterium]|nr:cation:dicarboxylase symporter family transporter [Bacteroidia bacterium]